MDIDRLSIIDIFPQHGIAGSEILICGSGFSRDTEFAFGSTLVSTTFVSDDRVVAIAPSAPASSSVSVRVPNSGTQSRVKFVYDNDWNAWQASVQSFIDKHLWFAVVFAEIWARSRPDPISERDRPFVFRLGGQILG